MRDWIISQPIFVFIYVFVLLIEAIRICQKDFIGQFCQIWNLINIEDYNF